MAQSKVLQQSIEFGYLEDIEGKNTKQVIPNLKDTSSSEQILALGALFAELVPEKVTLQDIVTVKRTRHTADV